jgi:hypothetical protein
MRATSLLPLATIAIAIASPLQQSADCILPSWSVHSASATYSDESLAPGKGSFVLTHHLTNITEKIECALAFNTACRVAGTPADPQLQYQFQVNMDFSWVVFNKSWVCEGQVVDPKRWVDAGIFVPSFLLVATLHLIGFLFAGDGLCHRLISVLCFFFTLVANEAVAAWPPRTYLFQHCY